MTLIKHTLKALSMGIDTHQEPVAYMRQDCHICRSEGFDSNARLLLVTGKMRSYRLSISVYLILLCSV